MAIPDPALPLLAVEDLYLHYLGGPVPTVHAVDGISFALRGRGTALGVVRERVCKRLCSHRPRDGRPPRTLGANT